MQLQSVYNYFWYYRPSIIYLFTLTLAGNNVSQKPNFLDLGACTIFFFSPSKQDNLTVVVEDISGSFGTESTPLLSQKDKQNIVQASRVIC